MSNHPNRSKAAITRSTGLKLTGALALAAIGKAPGGGYSGITDELDKMVEDAAGMLVEAFGYPVEIRFNSDHKSGGAFIEGVPGTVGITAQRWDLVESRKFLKEFLDKEKQSFAGFCRERRLNPRGPRYQTTVSVYIGHDDLKDLSVANEIGFAQRPYAILPAASLRDGLALIYQHTRLGG